MKDKIILILILMLACSANNLASDSLDTKEQINALKQADILHEKQNKVIEDKIVNSESHIMNRIDSEVINYQRGVWAALLFFVLSFGGIAFFWSKISQIVRNRVEQEIAAHIQQYRQYLIDMTRNYKNEIETKMQASILVVTKNHYHDEGYHLKNFFDIAGFRQIEFAEPDADTPYHNFDCILFDNLQDEFTDAEIEGITNMANHNASHFFLTKRRVAISSIEDKANFANSIYQLYGNLMSTLIARKTIIQAKSKASSVGNSSLL